MPTDAITELTKVRLMKLLEAPCECQTLDFKQSIDIGQTQSVVELAKDVLAMANTNGGHLIIGVEDTSRRRIGVPAFVDSKAINDKIGRYCGGHISVLAAVHQIRDEGGQSVSIEMIYVPIARQKVPAQDDGAYPDPKNPGKQKWVFRKGDVYVRKGDESVKAETPDDLLPPKKLVPPSVAQVQRDLKALQNPYDFATAATQQMFKGRAEEVEGLLDSIESGTHVAVFGLQRIGKTSLVEETLSDRLSKRDSLKKGVLFASLDFQRIGTEYSTYRGLLSAMVRAIAEKISPSKLQAVEDQLALMSRSYDRGSKREMLTAFASLIGALAGSAKRRIVLFLDEFSELCRVIERNEELARRNPDRILSLHPHEMLIDVDLMHWFSSLVKSSVIRGKLIFIFAMRPFVADYDTQKNLQLLKVTRSITLYHLNENAARSLITDPIRGVIAVEDEARDYLVRLTAGHPYLIQVILKDVVDRLKREGRPVLQRSDIVSVEERLISEGPAYDAQFKVLDSDYSVDYVINPGKTRVGNGALAVIAKIGSEKREGWVGIRDICNALAVHTISFEETHAILDQLLRAKIIEEREVEGELHVRMSIPLLRKRYMRQNMYPKYFQGLSKATALR